VATVPRRARSGPIVVTSPLKQVQSRGSFAVVPSPQKKPWINGKPRLGHRLRATTGTWYGDPATSYSFSWLACNARGLHCKPVRGARTRTLKLGPRRLGRRFRVVVTVHTDSATGSARSAATGVVRR
jgi:hypothetical protein